MRYAFLLLTLTPLIALAQEGKVEPVVLAIAGGKVTVGPRGRLYLAPEGGDGVGASLRVLHDNHWLGQSSAVVTEREVQPDGGVKLTSLIAAQGAKNPLIVRLTAAKVAQGVKVRYEFEKAAECSVQRGIPLRISLPLETWRGRWLEARKVLTTPIPSMLNCQVSGYRLQTGAQSSLDLEVLTGPRPLAGEAGGGKSFTLSLNLAPEEPAVGEVEAAEILISFPGEMTPEALARKTAGPPRITQVTPSARQVGRFEKLELTVALQATYDNPFDPEQVALDATFAGPKGRQEVPGFLYQGYRRQVVDGLEVLTKEGPPEWRVRFAPSEVGDYSYELRLKDAHGEAKWTGGKFTCVDSPSKGFIRVDPRDRRRFAYDDGSPFFAIGHNVPTYHTTWRQLPDETLRKMHEAGENFNRWWMYSRSLGIEWCHQVGWYRLDRAWQLDYALELADRYDMHYMLCLDTHQDYRGKQSWVAWWLNPYNQAMGGPIAEPREWFTNPEAKQAYRKRLRYMVARWGYDPRVFAWEFGNEFQGWAGYSDEEGRAWHEEMSEYLHQLDPFDHLVSTSFWGSPTHPETWNLPHIDFVQTHSYSNRDADQAQIVADLCRQRYENFDKPQLFAEYGIRSGAGTGKRDPTGVHLHQGNWAALMSMCSSNAMTWWHESYVDPLDLYHCFTGVANFVRGMPLGAAQWRPLQVEQVQWAEANRPEQFTDLRISGGSSGWQKPTVNEFTVTRDGKVSDREQLVSRLQGRGHQDLKNPPTFLVDFPQDSRFGVQVGRVSSGGVLEIYVDDQPALNQELPTGENIGKEWRWVERWKLWESVYDQEFFVPVSRGKHRIRVDNTGRDWMVVQFIFEKYLSDRIPPLRVLGMQNDSSAVFWCQNRADLWYERAAGKAIKPLDPTRFTVAGLTDGAYELEWWDTSVGKPTRTDAVQVTGGKLLVELPRLETDVAAKLRQR